VPVDSRLGQGLLEEDRGAALAAARPGADDRARALLADAAPAVRRRARDAVQAIAGGVVLDVAVVE
jgi:hypothetical protein